MRQGWMSTNYLDNYRISDIIYSKLNRTRVNQRIPQVPCAPLLVLAEFLTPFRVQFAQANSADNLERYVTELLNEHPNKNCETIASVVSGTSPQRLHHLLTEMVWDERRTSTASESSGC
jgi:hypothetical protein